MNKEHRDLYIKHDIRKSDFIKDKISVIDSLELGNFFLYTTKMVIEKHAEYDDAYQYAGVVILCLIK